METNEPITSQGRATRSSRFHTHLHRTRALARRLWWIPIGAMILGAGIAAILLWRGKPLYVSYGQMIMSIKLSIPEGSLYNEELLNFMGTQVALMQSAEVLNRAGSDVQTNSPNLPPVPVKVQVAATPKTTIFLFKATGAEPRYTRAYLQACMEEYIALKNEMRAQTSETTLAGITEELARLEGELRKGEEELVAFQTSNSVVFLQEQGDSAGNYLSNLNRQLADLQTEYQLLKMLTLEQNLDRQYQKSGADSGANGGDSFQPDSDYLHAKQEIQMLKAEEQQLGEYLRPKHPKMVQLSDDISQREKLLEIFRQQSQEQLGDRRDSIGLQITNLQQQVTEWEAKSLDSSKKMAEYQKIKSNNQRIQNLYDRLLGTMQTLDVNKEISPESVSIMEPASVAMIDRISVAKTFIIAIILGLAAGIGILILIDHLDDRLASFTELQDEFDEEILGQIPKVSATKKTGEIPLIAGQDDRHSFVEAYRNLRSSLLFLPHSGERPKVILITSSIPNDGKSVIAANLALTIASTGSRVLLVDADLRKGVQHQRFEIAVTAGLHETLEGNEPWESLIKTTRVKNLFLLPRGAVTHHSSELFLNPKTPTLLREIAAQYDYVIIDTAPIMAADDATSLAPFVDGVLFIVRANRTSARIARAALDLLYQRRAHVLGLVLNAVEANASEYYYYKYKDYYAGYPTK